MRTIIIVFIILWGTFNQVLAQRADIKTAKDLGIFSSDFVLADSIFNKAQNYETYYKFTLTEPMSIMVHNLNSGYYYWAYDTNILLYEEKSNNNIERIDIDYNRFQDFANWTSSTIQGLHQKVFDRTNHRQLQSGVIKHLKAGTYYLWCIASGSRDPGVPRNSPTTLYLKMVGWKNNNPSTNPPIIGSTKENPIDLKKIIRNEKYSYQIMSDQYTLNTKNIQNFDIYFQFEITYSKKISFFVNSFSKNTIILYHKQNNGVFKEVQSGNVGLIENLFWGKYIVKINVDNKGKDIINVLFESEDYKDDLKASSNKNYIHTRTFTNEEGRSWIDNIQYFDGLGRLTQAVQKDNITKGTDLITLQEYDNFGRESNTWLPSAIKGNNGAYINPNIVKEKAQKANNDLKPYNVPIYEQSPLNRIIEQYGEGEDWHNNKKSIKTNYTTNNGTSGELSCAMFSVDGEKVKKNNFYANAQLYVTKMTDEDDNVSYEFKDKLGQVVLTRQIEKDSKTQHDTYYVYDDFGNLRFVLPPLISEVLIKTNGTWGPSNTALFKDYAYYYKYDSRNRCIWKKIPGAEPIFYVYDKADRLIFTQDGEQRLKNEWLFSISDGLGRNILTGTVKNNAAIKLGMWDDTKIAPIVKGKYVVGAAHLGYQISGYTFTPTTYISANYYDNYNFLGSRDIPNNNNTIYSPQAGYGIAYGDHKDLVKSKGLLTGSLVAQFPSGSMLYSIMYYDDRGQIIQTLSNNHVGGTEKEYIAYNYVGQPTKKMHIHYGKDNIERKEIYINEYDHAGRLLEVNHEYYEKGVKKSSNILAKNTYDDLGRLKTNTKGNNLTISFDYNVRSWTKFIETRQNNNILFSQNLYYNEPKMVAYTYSDYKPSYSGNIAGMEWQLQGEGKRSNRFLYDGLTRLKGSMYKSSNAAQDGAYNTSYTYDKQGNILSIMQYGLVNGATKLIDNLKMEYNGTNKLQNVHNSGSGLQTNSSAHFQDYSKDVGGKKIEYFYNSNGAMTQDLNKGTSIEYNSLNLPTRLTIDNITKGGKAKGTIEYTYSASGVKLRTKHIDNASTTRFSPMMATGAFSGVARTKVTDYIGNKIYEELEGKTSLKILVDGGYIKDGKYYYYVTDHLGNNRGVIEQNSPTLSQKTHYYPFGMAYAETTGEKEQPFKYNGKELDSEMQLYTYDYAARYMDPAIARFTSIDPLAEKKPWLSPYQYGRNNPMRFIDPDGQDEWEINSIGEIIKHISTEEHDAFYIVDENGERIEGKSIVFDFGTFTYSTADSKQGTLELFSTNSEDAAYSLFELAADPGTENNDNMEWTVAETTETDESKFVVGTMKDSEASGVTTHLLNQKYTVMKSSHNHPSGIPVPSEGDVLVSYRMTLPHNTNAKSFIYTPRGTKGKAIPYSKRYVQYKLLYMEGRVVRTIRNPRQ